MLETTLQWLVGLLISLGLGHIIVRPFLEWLRERLGLPTREWPSYRVYPELTGFLERLFFTLFVGLDAGGPGTTMMAWLALKMAATWNKGSADNVGEQRDVEITYAFTALLAGLVSMGFALVGGLVAAGHIWP